MTQRARFSLFAAIATLMLSPNADPASAAEITLWCPPPMRSVIVELVAGFERASGQHVTITFAPSKAIIERLEAGEKTDVAVLTAQASDRMIAAGRLARRVDLAKSTIGVAVRAGAPKPDVGSADAFRWTLLSATSFARNEGADSGIYMKSLIERLGIAEQMKGKTKLVPSGYVAELVARGEVAIGAQQVSELMAVKGVDVIPLPAELQHVIVFSAGLSASPASPAVVDALVKFLTAPDAASTYKARGLDPA